MDDQNSDKERQSETEDQRKTTEVETFKNNPKGRGRSGKQMFENRFNSNFNTLSFNKRNINSNKLNSNDFERDKNNYHFFSEYKKQRKNNPKGRGRSGKQMFKNRLNSNFNTLSFNKRNINSNKSKDFNKNSNLPETNSEGENQMFKNDARKTFKQYGNISRKKYNEDNNFNVSFENIKSIADANQDINILQQNEFNRPTNEYLNKNYLPGDNNNNLFNSPLQDEIKLLKTKIEVLEENQKNSQSKYYCVDNCTEMNAADMSEYVKLDEASELTQETFKNYDKEKEEMMEHAYSILQKLYGDIEKDNNDASSVAESNNSSDGEDDDDKRLNVKNSQPYISKKNDNQVVLQKLSVDNK